MQTHEFLGHVQHRAALPDLDAAMRAARATLETLAERIGPDEANDLSAQLPREIGEWLKAPPEPERFSSDEFLQRVSLREAIDLPASVHHTRAVLEVLQEAVSAGEIKDVLQRLPEDYQRLFTGSQGKMGRA